MEREDKEIKMNRDKESCDGWIKKGERNGTNYQSKKQKPSSFKLLFVITLNLYSSRLTKLTLCNNPIYQSLP